MQQDDREVRERKTMKHFIYNRGDLEIGAEFNKKPMKATQFGSYRSKFIIGKYPAR